ncbi:MAG: hypothetical protein WDN49_28005 [Acetobacteraceae bacterium]
MMPTVPGLVVAVPLLAAILLALLPQWRVAAWVNVGAAAAGLRARLPPAMGKHRRGKLAAGGPRWRSTWCC